MSRVLQSNMCVYKVSNQFNYYYNDEHPELVASDLNIWECQILIRKFQRDDDTIPLNPSGFKQMRYKYCRMEDWEKVTADREQTTLF